MRTTKLVSLGEVVSAREVDLIAATYEEAGLRARPLGAITYDPVPGDYKFMWHPPVPALVEHWVLRCLACDGLFASSREERPNSNRLYCGDRCRVRAQRGQYRTGTVPCGGCGAPIDGRLTKRYCSAACRQRAYRMRLAAAG